MTSDFTNVYAKAKEMHVGNYDFVADMKIYHTPDDKVRVYAKKNHPWDGERHLATISSNGRFQPYRSFKKRALSDAEERGFDHEEMKRALIKWGQPKLPVRPRLSDPFQPRSYRTPEPANANSTADTAKWIWAIFALVVGIGVGLVVD